MENQELINDIIKPKDTIQTVDLGLKRTELMNIPFNIVFFCKKNTKFCFCCQVGFFSSHIAHIVFKALQIHQGTLSTPAKTLVLTLVSDHRGPPTVQFHKKLSLKSAIQRYKTSAPHPRTPRRLLKYTNLQTD